MLGPCQWALRVGEVHAHRTEMIVGLLAQARVLQYIQPVLLEGLHAAVLDGPVLISSDWI